MGNDRPHLDGPAFLGKRQSPEPDGINDPSFTIDMHYSKLRGDHCVRLLALNPSSNENKEVVCTLKEHYFDKAIPKFTALSYTWGSLENPKTVLLDGRQAAVTSNLHAALTHLRHAESKRLLWIDALCINQQDIQERNQQVYLMRDIYMVAEGVLAWLGPATPDINPDDGSAVYRDIISRPYWTRVWIIQEFILGKKVVLQCGNVLYDWDKLNNSFPSRHDRRGGEKLHHLFDLKRRLGPKVKALPAAEAIRFAHESEATDPRDRFYGILGLIRNDGNRFAMFDDFESWWSQLQTPDPVTRKLVDRIRPDYGLSICQVYAQASEIVRRDGDFVIPARQAMQEEAMKEHRASKGCHIEQCNGVACGTEDRFKVIVGLD